MVPSACATTPQPVLGLPSLFSVAQGVVGCCWISSQRFISPKLLPMGCVFGVLEVPGPGHCTNPASGALVVWRRCGPGSCAGFLAWVTQCLVLSSGMAADRSAVGNGCRQGRCVCFPCLLLAWQLLGHPGLQGWWNGCDASARCLCRGEHPAGPSQAESAWDFLEAHRELHWRNSGCACSHCSSCWCHRALLGCGYSRRVLASSWMPELPVHSRQAFPACSPPAPCLL